MAAEIRRYGNPRVDPLFGFCCTDAQTGEILRDATGTPVRADQKTGLPLVFWTVCKTCNGKGKVPEA